MHLLAQLVKALLIERLRLVVAAHEESSSLSPWCRQSLQGYMLNFLLLLMHKVFLDGPSMSLDQLFDLLILLCEEIEVLCSLANHVFKLKHGQ